MWGKILLSNLVGANYERWHEMASYFKNLSEHLGVRCESQPTLLGSGVNTSSCPPHAEIPGVWTCYPGSTRNQLCVLQFWSTFRAQSAGGLSQPGAQQIGHLITSCMFRCFSYLLCCVISCSVYTSSSAQGGGGSFKDRKPVGEVVAVNHGWQSEWTEKWLELCLWSGCNGQLTNNCWM